LVFIHGSCFIDVIGIYSRFMFYWCYWYLFTVHVLLMLLVFIHGSCFINVIGIYSRIILSNVVFHFSWCSSRLTETRRVSSAIVLSVFYLRLCITLFVSSAIVLSCLLFTALYYPFCIFKHLLFRHFLFVCLSTP
jgi:hypothetical protein